jgi:hypothetical protein
MKKQFWIILIILCIIVAIVALTIYNGVRLKSLAEDYNKAYESYYEQEILGTTLISIINKTIDQNEKNAVPKEQNSIYYIDNEENSIQIQVKFLESDNIIKMEDIEQQETENFIKYFATSTFKCTKIEYHPKTNKVKSLYFEQIAL